MPIRGKCGFTLTEVIIVLGIFSILAVVVSQALFTTLKGSAKSEIASSIKREGDYVVAVMERAIHNAKFIDTCGSGRIAYRDTNSRSGLFDCTQGRVASGSAVITSDQTSVTRCIVTCSPSAPPYKSVDVNMTFERPNPSGVLRPEEKAKVELKTKILLRN